MVERQRRDLVIALCIRAVMTCERVSGKVLTSIDGLSCPELQEIDAMPRLPTWRQAMRLSIYQCSGTRNWSAKTAGAARTLNGWTSRAGSTQGSLAVSSNNGATITGGR